MSTKARDRKIEELFEIANELVSNYSWELFKKMWDLCSDWNSTHPYNEEIFMCETSDDDDNVNGFMIEDDVWYWKA